QDLAQRTQMGTLPSDEATLRDLTWQVFASHEMGDVRWTQCQAQLLDQFSVWVPPVTPLKRLTPGLRARAGCSDPGRRRWTRPAPQNRLAPPTQPTQNSDRLDGGSRAPDSVARYCRM